MKPVGFVFGLILICILRENEMEIFVFVFLLYFGAIFLFFLLEIFVESFVITRESYMSRKNRLIIRHWDWLREMGYHETGNIILKKMSKI